jgi:sugar phosphate isomerase/epimerase
VTGIRTLGYLTLDAPPLDTIDAAAAAGFSSVGIRITGRRVADPYTDVLGNRQAIAAIRRRIADTGLSLSNISAYHLYPDVAVDDLKRVMEAVVELGAGILVANSYDPDERAYVDKLARYCELGATAGVRIAVEFMRYSAVRTIHDASRVVRAVGAANAGILVDALHLARSGGTPADVKRLDPRAIVFAQLCDGKCVHGELDDDQLRHEARTGRLYPGDGSLPLAEFLAALPPGTEIEYEVPRQDLGALTLAERAKVAFSVFQTYLDGKVARSA